MPPRPPHPHSDDYRPVGLAPHQDWGPREYREWLMRQVRNGNPKVLSALKDPEALRKLEVILRTRYEKERVVVVNFGSFSPGVSEGGRGQGTGANVYRTGDREEFRRVVQDAQRESERLFPGPELSAGRPLGAVPNRPTHVPLQPSLVDPWARVPPSPPPAASLSSLKSSVPRNEKGKSKWWTEQYLPYINGPGWKAKKAEYRASGRPYVCACCGSSQQVQLHHKTYERLGRESLDDLVPLCKTHHEQLDVYLKERGLTNLRTDEVIREYQKVKTLMGSDPTKLPETGAYLRVRVPFRELGRTTPEGKFQWKHVGSLSGAELLAFEEHEEFLRNHPDPRLRRFYHALKFAQAQPGYQEKVEPFLGAPGDRYSPSDQERTQLRLEAGITLSLRNRGGSMWMEGKGSEEIRLGSAEFESKLLEDKKGALEVFKNYKARRREQRYPKDFDPSRMPAWESEMRLALWKQFGGLPNVGPYSGNFARGRGLSSFLYKDEFGVPHYGGVRERFEREVRAMRNFGIEQALIRRYKRSFMIFYQAIGQDAIDRMVASERAFQDETRGAGLGFGEPEYVGPNLPPQEFVGPLKEQVPGEYREGPDSASRAETGVGYEKPGRASKKSDVDKERDVMEEKGTTELEELTFRGAQKKGLGKKDPNRNIGYITQRLLEIETFKGLDDYWDEVVEAHGGLSLLPEGREGRLRKMWAERRNVITPTAPQ